MDKSIDAMVEKLNTDFYIGSVQELGPEASMLEDPNFTNTLIGLMVSNRDFMDEVMGYLIDSNTFMNAIVDNTIFTETLATNDVFTTELAKNTISSDWWPIILTSLRRSPIMELSDRTSN